MKNWPATDGITFSENVESPIPTEPVARLAKCSVEMIREEAVVNAAAASEDAA